jgi:hypothetical protein
MTAPAAIVAHLEFERADAVAVVVPHPLRLVGLQALEPIRFEIFKSASGIASLA